MSLDTSTEAARVRIAALAKLSGEDRLLEALSLSDSVAEISEAGRRARAAGEEGSAGPAVDGLSHSPP